MLTLLQSGMKNTTLWATLEAVLFSGYHDVTKAIPDSINERPTWDERYQTAAMPLSLVAHHLCLPRLILRNVSTHCDNV